jgi:hypothetical protein
MAVGVGSFTDPAEMPGLAHYLEHMLFMGSDKYPKENEYDTYLNNHGGSSNAYTELVRGGGCLAFISCDNAASAYGCFGRGCPVTGGGGSGVG